MKLKIWLSLTALLLTMPAMHADQPSVTYTINAEEALNGPKPFAANFIIDALARKANIAVDAGAAPC